MDGPLCIGLHSWIIQDGNYGDFAVGQRAAFALEFATRSLTACAPALAPQPVSMVQDADQFYRVRGRVAFANAKFWVLDAGLPVYSAVPTPPGPEGTLVEGVIELGIDPFPYFERLAFEPGAPPLIFDWRIDAIALDTVPSHLRGPGIGGRDPKLSRWAPVPETDAFTHDDRSADYLLTCTRIAGEPRRHLRYEPQPAR